MDYVSQLAKFLEDMQGTSVKTMEELVKFNKDHFSNCFPAGVFRISINGDEVIHTIES